MNIVNIQELLHKRVLVAEKDSSWKASSTIVEIKILEISPSEKFVKIQNQHGNKYWKNSSELQVIEVLENNVKFNK